MKDETWLQKVAETHVPKNGFKDRTQYRRLKDALTTAFLKNPKLMDAKSFREIQEALRGSADMLLEDLTAKKMNIPLAEVEETQEPQGPVIDAEPTSNGHVVPYRKTG